VRALGAIGARHNYSFKLLKTVIEVNNQQREIACQKIARSLNTALRGNKVLSVLGLAFKPNTDDIRESASIAIIKKLKGAVSLFRCYDPKAETAARSEFSKLKNVRICKTIISAARGADALFLATEWKEFIDADWKEIQRVMRGNYIIDGRNALDRKKMESLGFVYDGFGV
jgi:UDPglucose 6-dehydrogenase